ncbi:conserved exported protein of unknown function [Tepidanaerobacter acetatoxydans Re1]|uniref:Uncharacterized protein n=1 Tax=Tepidanaerobacter acetatoxydans (strain DSM 21804 / JCM 16047 / Re1) TaxID=1209989 RepID=F4LX16_TEPAE|nr:hypothetical protein [Tepidanaerobacter acetatoxydans]AEE90994.1 hypothetical protein TepRe1_0811 [Tepidanaerobacter acetatoxydans Re1]CCP25595.1 conserved exported protein of unknown function [Tepidanaerobacter acetatoxydans Re1]
MKNKLLFICITAALVLAILTPALFREGSTIPVIKGTVRLALSNDIVVPIDSARYITRNEDGADLMISFVENKGWKYRGRYGEGYVFQKYKKPVNMTISIGSEEFLKYFRLWKTTPDGISLTLAHQVDAEPRGTSPWFTTNYAPDTKDRYIASIARQKGITFEEAKKINDTEVSLLLKGRPADEEIRYKTVDKHAGDIRSNKKIFEVNMSTEVRYLWSNTHKKPLEIDNIVAPVIYIPDAGISAIVGGEFNIEQTLTKIRASQTAVVTYAASSSLGITAEQDISNISAASGGMVYLTTNSNTYVLNIELADLY